MCPSHGDAVKPKERHRCSVVSTVRERGYEPHCLLPPLCLGCTHSFSHLSPFTHSHLSPLWSSFSSSFQLCSRLVYPCSSSLLSSLYVPLVRNANGARFHFRILHTDSPADTLLLVFHASASFSSYFFLSVSLALVLGTPLPSCILTFLSSLFGPGPFPSYLC